jgi:hypothetical protein
VGDQEVARLILKSPTRNGWAFCFSVLRWPLQGKRPAEAVVTNQAA